MPRVPASDVAHYAGLEFWGPYDRTAIDAYVAAMDPAQDTVALDVGCGDGAVLERLARAHALRVVGVDRSAAALDLARARFAAAGLAERATWLERDAADLSCEPGSLEVVAWLGGPFVGGSHASSVRAFARWLRPGGWLLMGQGYWAAPPPAPYLAATGLAADDLDDERTMLAAARAAGFVIREHARSTRAAWDAFEDTLLAGHERHAAEAPDDVDRQARVARKRAWAEAQRRWGRATMGFALVVARRAP